MRISNMNMYKHVHFLGISVILSITSVWSEPREPASAQPCGGRLKAPAGVIQTPNFPDPFPVPMKCRWIIENDLVNGTISIYFTQQYTTSGLTFTEYMYYDDTYKLGERKALTITEENITRIKWLQVTSPVLVVELSLARLEGTQLRALGLLQVFGFNVTYAVRRADRAAPRSCSALECRLLGHCLAAHDYESFYCACFAGFSGVDCGAGPLCRQNPHVCHNGGTCRQLGAAAVSCACAPGYTGQLCEASVAAPECGAAECGEGCAGSGCDCRPKEPDASTVRLETRLEFQAERRRGGNTAQELAEQIKAYLKDSKISVENVEIFDVRATETAGVSSYGVWLWTPRSEAGSARAAVARLAAGAPASRRHVFSAAPAPLEPAVLALDVQPALHLQSLVVNQRPELWEGAEFILSCVAYGSPAVQFHWYKDGLRVNFNATTRDMWTRSVAEDALGRRMSVLGVAAARAQDAGHWACVASDATRRRCRALSLVVSAKPSVTLLPHASLTVNKGDNVSLTCLAGGAGGAGGARGTGALGFSWARERTLLPLHTRHHEWEDLFPAGSLLKLYNVQKSAEYRCSATSSGGTASRSVWIWALEAGAAACAADEERGVLWPRTAPAARTAAPCPPGYSGDAARFCEPQSEQRGVQWGQPDFSGCVADSLNKIYEQFTRIELGFSWRNVAELLQQYLPALTALPALPGHGAAPLRHCRHMLHYLQSAAGNVADRNRSAPYLLNIFDSLLHHPDSFMDEQNIFELQDAVANTGAMRDNIEMTLTQLSISTKRLRDDSAAHFTFQVPSSNTEEWIATSAGLELSEHGGQAIGVGVRYNNLIDRLPSLKRFTEFKSGRVLQYRLVSQQVQLSHGAAAAPRAVSALFIRADNDSTAARGLACALRTPEEPQRWRGALCVARVATHTHTHVSCRCAQLGTLALVAISTPSSVDGVSDLRDVVKMSFGLNALLCTMSGVVQLVALASGRGRLGRGGDWLGGALRVAVCAAHAIATLALLHIHPTQQGSGYGGVDWMVAAGWMAAGAALCAQPLLLQADLARTARPAAAPAIVAGVCILSWLTARLIGGAPLAGGGAAHTVLCAAGGTLATLCAASAAAVASKLRGLEVKLPHEKKTYLKDRHAVVRHTTCVLVTSLAWQACGVLYLQRAHLYSDTAAAVVATIHGLSLAVCYAALDAGVRHLRRPLLAGCPRRTPCHNPPPPELHLYVRQGHEAESAGGAPGYWRAPLLDTPPLHRRQSTPDGRADIVRCVERHPVCDLVSHIHAQPAHTPHPPVVCFPLVTHKQIPEPLSPTVSCSVHYDPCLQLQHAPHRQPCNICVQSNPDVSVCPSPAVKSCLKRPKRQLTTSLPSIGVNSDDPASKSNIAQVNRDWYRVYKSPDSEKVLYKISTDLDFLLNRAAAPHSALEQTEKVNS